MKCYFLNINESQLLNLITEETKIEDNFLQNEEIIFLIDKRIVAKGKVNEKRGISFSHILYEEDRFPLLGKIRKELNEVWGFQIEDKITKVTPINEKVIKEIENKLELKSDAYGYYLTNMESLLEEAKKKETNKAQKNKREETPKFERIEILEKDTHTDHTKAQYLIKKIGEIVDCETWIASNDKNRIYNGYRLGENTLETFPQFSLTEKEKRVLYLGSANEEERILEKEAVKRIELIDAVWFKNKQPVAAFEVETTTSIYSGLLRFCDMLATIPNNSIELYIVAPKERKEKVMKELRRPVFMSLGLNEHCKFISIEELELLYQKIKGLTGYVDYKVMKVIEKNVEGEMHA